MADKPLCKNVKEIKLIVRIKSFSSLYYHHKIHLKIYPDQIFLSEPPYAMNCQISYPDNQKPPDYKLSIYDWEHPDNSPVFHLSSMDKKRHSSHRTSSRKSVYGFSVYYQAQLGTSFDDVFFRQLR